MNYFQTIRDAVILLALLIVPAVFLRATLPSFPGSTAH
jgi:hypothetical protein